MKCWGQRIVRWCSCVGARSVAEGYKPSRLCISHSQAWGNLAEREAILTDNEILELIACRKSIGKKEPVRGYKEEYGHRRCDLGLESIDDEDRFTVFIRQCLKFSENFSVGLRYHTNDRTLGTITLARYNGPHGETSMQPDGHFAASHIHRITEVEIASGSSQPQEKHREITARYSTLNQALPVFFVDTGVTNYLEYFPDVVQGRLFGGYQ